MKFEWECRHFNEIGERTVAFICNARATICREGRKRPKFSNNYWKDQGSVFVEHGKAYFLDFHDKLVEWDLVSFKETILMENVYSMSGPPSDPKKFLAISKTGLLQTSWDKRELKDVFAKMSSDFDWRAILSIDNVAVVAGFSRHSILTGEKIPKEHNYFLLVNLGNLEVINKENPIAVEWIRGSSII